MIALIVIVAALNILIALTMMVMEKTRDIAVLMSFGVESGAGAANLPDAGPADQSDWHGAGLMLGYVAAWAGGHYHSFHFRPMFTPLIRFRLRRAPWTA